MWFQWKFKYNWLRKGKETFSVKAHKSIINGIDGIGGRGNIGPAEIITSSRDGNIIFNLNKII